MPKADVIQPSQFIAYNAPGKTETGNVAYYYFDYDSGTGNYKGAAALAENTDGTLTFWMYDANFGDVNTIYTETFQFTWSSPNGASITTTVPGKSYFVITTNMNNVANRYVNNYPTPYPGIGGTRFNPTCGDALIAGVYVFRTVLTPIGGKGSIIRLLDVHHFENGHTANQLLGDNPSFGFPDLTLLGVVKNPTLTSLTPSNVNVSQSLTLTGTNLTTAYRPYFNSLAHPGTTFALVSTTQMTVTVPNISLGAATVFLTDGSYTTNSLELTISAAVQTGPPSPPAPVVTPKPAPVVNYPTLVSISVIPAALTLTEGQNKNFSAIGTYSDTSTLTLGSAQDLSWTVTNSNGTGSIDPNSGFFVAQIAGSSVIVTATAGGISGTANVTIAQRPIPPAVLDSITISPVAPTVLVGNTVQFSVVGTATIYADSAGQIVSSQQTVYPAVAWTVTNGTGAGSIDSFGLFTATDLRNGLDAQFWNGTPSGYLPSGGTGPIARTPDVTTILQSVSFGGNYGALPAGVNSAYVYARLTGYLIPPESGTYTIGVDSSNGVNLIVNGQGLVYGLQSIQVAQPGVVYTASGTINLVAGVRYPIIIEWQETTNAPYLQLLWTPPSLLVQPVPPSCLEGDTGTGATCTVNAEATDGSGVSANQTVTITAEPPPASPVSTLATMTVSPQTTVVTSGSYQQFVVIAYDQYGNALTPSVTWSIVNGSGAGTIDPASGLFYGEIAGTGIVVTATTNDAAGLTSSAAITVIAGPLSRLSITPPSVLLSIGQSQQFSVTGYDSYGNAKLLNTVAWGVAGGVGTTSTTGFFTAVGSGVGTLVAAYGNLSTSATVNVQEVVGGVTVLGAPQQPFARIHLQDSVSPPLVIDTRRRGGGLRSANVINLEDDFWWDLTTFDGLPFPMYGVYASRVYLPALSGQTSSTTTTTLIQNVLSKYAAPQFLSLITPDSTLPANPALA